MQCLFIQGPSGSGKSTLAKRLAQRLDWELLDRDDIAGERSLVYKKMQERLESLLKRKSVIVDAPFFYEDEDAFSEWIQPLPKHSELVVSLQTPPAERKRRREKRGLQRDRVSNWPEVLQHEEESYSPLPGSLLLSGETPPYILEDAVLWHLGAEGRGIREVATDDLETVWLLKKEILESSFAEFLYPDELVQETKQVASRQAVKKLIEENEVLVAEQEGVPWAMLAASSIARDEEGKLFRKIFSGYSKGNHAATALGTLLLSRAQEEKLDYLLAWVYRDNEQSKHVLRSFGFQPTGGHHENPLVPRVPVEHWVMPLRARHFSKK